MQFDWNDGNIAHIAVHNVTPAEVEQVIANEPLDVSTSLRNGELRTVHLGESDAGRLLFVVITERVGMLRTVTARDAHKKERIFYTQHKAEADDANS